MTSTKSRVACKCAFLFPSPYKLISHRQHLPTFIADPTAPHFCHLSSSSPAVFFHSAACVLFNIFLVTIYLSHTASRHPKSYLSCPSYQRSLSLIFLPTIFRSLFLLFSLLLSRCLACIPFIFSPLSTCLFRTH